MESKLLIIVSLCIFTITFVTAPWVYSLYKGGDGARLDAEPTPAPTDHPRTENKYLPTRAAPFRRFLSKCGTVDFSAIGCDLCKVIVSGLKNLVSKKSTREDVVIFATEICKLFRIEDFRVCDSITVQFQVRFQLLPVLLLLWS